MTFLALINATYFWDTTIVFLPDEKEGFAQYHVDKTLTARPGATFQEYTVSVITSRKLKS